jgi:hypothetical protein
MCDAEGCAPLSAGSGSRRVADQKPCVDQPLDEISALSWDFIVLGRTTNGLAIGQIDVNECWNKGRLERALALKAIGGDWWFIARFGERLVDRGIN